MKIYCQSLHLFPNGPIRSLDDSGHGKTSSHGIYGATIATHRFLPYLLSHGNFDQFHLLVPGAILSTDDALRENILGKLSNDSRIVLKASEEFSRNSKDGRYHVLHQPDGPVFLRPLSLRSRQQSSNLPVTGVTHSISYQFLLQELALLLMAGPRPWDSLVCTSSCGRKVIEALLDHVAENLKRETGISIDYAGRLDVIPLGVDTEQFRPRDKSRVRRLLQLPPERVIFLWFGRFSIYDKADLRPLLIAFRKACDKLDGNKPLLLFAGEDVRAGAAEVIAKTAADLGLAEDVLIRRNPSILAGPLYFSASDVFICPSDNIQETFGQTIIEAMSSGLPVICSDWNGFRDTVPQGTVGFRIPTYWAQHDSKLSDNAPNTPWQLDHLRLSQALCVDLEQMAGAIQKLAQDAGCREKMGAQARKHAIENFDWRVVIGKYEELWDTLSSIATRETVLAPRKTAWLTPSYVRHFQSFASIVLPMTSTVRTSDQIFRLEDGHDDTYLNRGLSSPFRNEIADSILAQSTNGISIAELQTQCLKFGIGAEDTTWYVLNLLKYGSLCLEKP